MNKRGFLFTIAVILFASTIVLYAQMYSSSNFLNERRILSSAKPVSALLLADDLAFGVARILGFTFDANTLGSTKQASFSGKISSSPQISTTFGSYSSFLDANFFPRSAGTKTLSLANLNDGVGEVYYGSVAEFDYNYNNFVRAFGTGGAQLSAVDLNIIAAGSLSSYEWTASAGTVSATIRYYDDSNFFTISSASIDANSISTLKLIYADGNSFVYLGRSTINGSDKNSSILIQPKSGQDFYPSAKLSYTSSLSSLPVKANALFRVADIGFDYNSLLVLKR